MRTLNLLCTLSLLCFSISLSQAQSTTGSGNVIEEERSMPAFSRVEVNNGIDIYIVQGNRQQVVVKADDNLVNKITTQVNGNTLKVSTNGNIRSAKAFDVYLTISDLEYIKASSGSDVKGESTLSLDRLELKMSSGSDVDLDLNVGELTCYLSGGSDARLTGKADDLNVEASGGSDIEAKNLKVDNCKLDVSGGSDAHIYVDGDLEVEASGASDVYISGNPNIISQRASGGSDIRTK